MPVPWLTYPGSMLVACSVGWLIVQTGRYLLPPLAPSITAAFGIGNAEFGFAITLLWAVYAVTNFPAGIASDDIGFKPVLVGSLLLAGIGLGGLAVAGTYIGLLLLLCVVGVAVAFFLVGSRTFLSVLYGERRGRAIGIHNAAGDVGGVLAPLLATAAVGVATWWSPFLGIVAAAVLVAVFFHVVAAGDYTVRRPEIWRPTRGAIADIATLQVAGLIVLYGTYVLVSQGVVAFVPLYLTQDKGLGLGTANAALSMLFLAGVVVKPLSGWASDVLGRRALTVGSLVTAGLALEFLVVADGVVAVIAGVVGFAALSKLFPPATQAYLFDRFDDASSGSAFGLSRAIYVLIGSTGPAVVGLGSEAVGFATTFGVLAAGLVIVATAFGIVDHFATG